MASTMLFSRAWEQSKLMLILESHLRGGRPDKSSKSNCPEPVLKLLEAYFEQQKYLHMSQVGPKNCNIERYELA